MRVLAPLALCASCVFAGCAPGPHATSSPYDDIDTARVATINRVASGHGVDVHWVRYPQRKPSDITPIPTTPPATDGTSMVLPIGT